MAPITRKEGGVIKINGKGLTPLTHCLLIRVKVDYNERVIQQMAWK